MRHPMLTRAFSVTAAAALAAGAALAVTGSAAASPAAARPTKLSIAEAKSGIYRGQKDVISGRLTNLRNSKQGLADETVYLCRVQGGKLVKVSSKVTGAAGKVSFTVRPGARTRYELVFPGVTHMLAPSHSRIVTVTVRHPKPGAA
jgi:hypothetical protein